MVFDERTEGSEQNNQTYQSKEAPPSSNEEGENGSPRRPLKGQDEVQPLSQEQYLQYHIQKNAEMLANAELMAKMQKELHHNDSQDSQRMTYEQVYREIEEKRFEVLREAGIKLQSEILTNE